VEIKFSKPINPSTAVANSFGLNHFQIVRQEGYGAGNNTISTPSISQVQRSNDDTRIFLQVGNIAAVDRLLKITAGGIRSSSGEQLYFNQTYFTHNYQSAQAFNPAGPTGIANRHAGDKYMDNRVSHFQQAGELKVSVKLHGAYTVSLRKFNGAAVEAQSGNSPQELTFQAKDRKGLYILQVAQGKRSYLRPVSF
jgi:hypothetical protein